MTQQQIKVIVADDDEFDRYVARRVLSKDDNIGAVGECADGLELVELLASPVFGQQWGPHPPPVLVLLDINMPRMGGFDVLRHLGSPSVIEADGSETVEKVSVEQACIVLMLTSSVSPKDREQAAAFPLVAGYLEKPIDNAKLSKVLAEVYPTFIRPDAAS